MPRVAHNKKSPIKGQRFHFLVVTGKEEKRNGRYYWEFKCDCGNSKWIIHSNVTRGITRSCGCFQKKATSESSFIDLTGRKFGRLTVHSDYKSDGKTIKWRCSCDCGKTKWINGASLRHERTKSCGCLMNESRGKTQRLRFRKGLRFGKLVVLGQSKSIQGKLFWECKCDCGGKTWVHGTSMKNGNTKSCGCLVRESAAKRSSAKNKYPVILSLTERKLFEEISNSRTTNKRDRTRAKILLLADRSNEGPALNDVQISKELRFTHGKVFYVRHAYANPEFRAKTNDRLRKSWDNDIEFKLKKLISHRIRLSLRSQNSSKNQKAIHLLGCTIEAFRSYLEKQFEDGMNWSNFGQYGWHLDHIRPCASFDLTNDEELADCFHYSNYQPMWAEENIKKSSKWDGKHWSKKNMQTNYPAM